ncbi:MAG: circularly permuted type 2 ATP-grasp protein [Pseudonocardiaceae bacterium]
MRSLGRPKPVDVILRRVDSSYCDPLELRSESQLGVPGLVEACRLGSVSVVNTLGSGVLENPGLLPLLPRLCQALLGEPLALDSVPTWWCGEPEARRYVLRHLNRLVVKSITREPATAGNPTTGRAGILTTAQRLLGWELSAAQRAELRRQIEARPYNWVGQERLDLGTVPALTEDGLAPRRAVLRAFLVARHDSYVAMPGGLVRVAAGAGSPFLASGTGLSDTGLLSKDIWVLASEPEDLAGFWLKPAAPVYLERAMCPAPAGSTSTRPTTNWWTTATSPPPGAATMPTCPLKGVIFTQADDHTLRVTVDVVPVDGSD